MTKTYLILILIIVTNLLFSQEIDCNCIDELNDISELIKNSKSYQVQIKKASKEADFKKWEEQIKQEIVKDSLSKYFCVGYLQKYTSFINDRHNQIYSEPENTPLNVPTYSKTIDTTQITNDEISGIYYAGSDKIFVKQENDSLWFGITLESKSSDWTKGKIRLRINKTNNDELELFEYQDNGLLFYQKNIKISDGRIHSTFWNKSNKYFFNKNHDENFSYKSLNLSYDYIGIKTLKRTTALIKESDNFYAENLKNLNNDNLIIDLRSNVGGSTNQAKRLLRAIKKNRSIKNIFVVINFKTASSAELTALELKKDKRTILVGENSRGMIEYGYGNRAFSTKTNCSGFKVVLSTKHTNSKLSKYEYIGIKPDNYLNNASDWLDQIINLEVENN